MIGTGSRSGTALGGGRSWARFRAAGLMSGGTALVGAAGYAFIALAGHTLPPADAAALASGYLLINIIGPGLFVALEQETNRVTSSALASRSQPRPLIRRAAAHGAVLTAAVLLVLAVLSPFLVAKSLLGHWELLFAVLVSTVSAAAVYFVRGVLGGLQQFDGYAVTLAAEGLMRLLPALAIAAVGIATAGLYGLIFALGSGAGAIAAVRWMRIARSDAPPDVVPADLVAEPSTSRVRGLVPLVGATLLSQVVANLAPIVVTARLASDAATAAAFAAGFILARVPLFLFSPLQAVVVPAVAAAASNGDHSGVRRVVRPVLVWSALIGVAGAAVLATAGPWALHMFFGTKAPISGTILGMLGVSTLLLIAAQILQAALVAMQAHLAVTVSWQISTATLIASLMLPIHPIHTAVLGQLVSSAVVVGAMTCALMVRLRVTSPSTVERVN